MQYFAIVIIFSSFRNVDLEVMTKLLAFSAFLTIIVLTFTLKENLISIQLQRLSANEEVNANRFAMMLSQLCAILFAFIIFKKNRLIQLLLVATVLVAVYMIILSGSRSALVGILLAISLTSFYLLIKQTKKYIIPLVLIAILGFIFWEQIQQLDIPIISRFTMEGIKESGGSQDRYTIWKTLIPFALTNNPLFGYGFGAENVIVLAKMHGLDKPAHNFLIDMFLQIGIVGVVLYFSYFVYVFKRLIKYLRQPLIFIPVLILVTAFFNGIGETIFSEKLFWNGIALAWLYMNNIEFNSNTTLIK
jgi:O-antigen ligase